MSPSPPDQQGGQDAGKTKGYRDQLPLVGFQDGRQMGWVALALAKLGGQGGGGEARTGAALEIVAGQLEERRTKIEMRASARSGLEDEVGGAGFVVHDLERPLVPGIIDNADIRRESTAVYEYRCRDGDAMQAVAAPPAG